MNAIIKVFDSLSNHILSGIKNKNIDLYAAINEAEHQNTWFVKDSIIYNLIEIANKISKKNILKFLVNYNFDNHKEKKEAKRIAVIMAGNIPLVGFFDLFFVLITGNIFIGKLSSKDTILMMYCINYLRSNATILKNRIFIENNIKIFKLDFLIATGSNNSSRYFDYNFNKIPKIIRKNRNSVAILTNEETEKELEKLSDDIFLYFGLGCRNVSFLFVPIDYDFSKLKKVFNKYRKIKKHKNYYDNYIYNKNLFLMQDKTFVDNDFFLLKEELNFNSPVSVINYQYYRNKETLKLLLDVNADKLQVIVSKDSFFNNSINFGKSQKPNLNDYADGIDLVDVIC